MRALLVDDERLARSELRRMLSLYREIEVVGEADGVDAALAQLERLGPELVFLDVQMPGRSGFELLEALPARQFAVVFVTAHDSWAVRAFEVNALDYLLKPVHPDRLALTLARVAAKGARAEPVPRPKLCEDDLLFLEDGVRSRFVQVDDLVRLRGADDYVEVVTADGRRTLSRQPLKEWEARLPGRRFARIHRSALINLARVERVERNSHGGGQVHLRSLDEPLPLSRTHAAELKERFG